MTPEQQIERARRAQLAWNEFFAPTIEDMIGEYTARIVTLANAELSPAKRADKITALSNGIRVAENLRNALYAVIVTGDKAAREKIKAEHVEQYSPARRRLLGIGVI